VPLLFRSRQGRFEKVLIPNPRKTAVFRTLVVVNGIDHDSAQPLGLGTPDHGLPGQFAWGVAVFLGGFGGDSQSPLGVRVVRCQQDSAVGFDGQDAVAGLRPQTVGHVLR
jgi:hypothetical protein